MDPEIEKIINEWDFNRAAKESEFIRDEMIQYRRIQVQLAAILPTIAIALLTYMTQEKITNTYGLLFIIAVLTLSLTISTSLLKSKIRAIGYLRIVLKSPWENALKGMRDVIDEEDDEKKINLLKKIYKLFIRIQRKRSIKFFGRMFSWLFSEGWLGMFQKALVLGHLLTICLIAYLIISESKEANVTGGQILLAGLIGIFLVKTLIEQLCIRPFIQSSDKDWKLFVSKLK